MRWFVFAIFAYLALALDQGLSVLWSDLLGGWSAAPSFMLILAVFISLWAPPRATYVAWLVLGILTDLSIPRGAAPDTGLEAFWILGPAALGYLLGAYAAVETRTLFLRESPIALAALVLFAGTFVHLLTIALITWRGVFFPLNEPVPLWSGTSQLFQHALELFYTAILAVPVAMLLRKTKDWFAFDEARGPHRPMS
jgi:hypothetical protein